eukprot:gene11888-biopygen267
MIIFILISVTLKDPDSVPAQMASYADLTMQGVATLKLIYDLINLARS